MRVVRVVITTFSSSILAKGAVSVILVIQGGLPIFPILAVIAEQGRLQRRVSYLVYFCEGMADAFANVRLKASEAAKSEKTDHSALLRELDQRQKQVLSLFTKSKYITTSEIAELLNIHPRTHNT